MRNFTNDEKVYADSLLEIREAFDDSVTRIARTAIRWGKLKVKKVQVLNALVLWFLGQSHETQQRIISEALPRLRQHHESETPLSIQPLSDVDVPLPGCDDTKRKRNGRHKP